MELYISCIMAMRLHQDPVLTKAVKPDFEFFEIIPDISKTNYMTAHN